MPSVLIADELSASALEIFRENAIDVDARPGLAPEALKACIAPYDGLAVRSATRVTAELLAAASSLTVVGRAGVGVDNIDVDAATARGIVVMNAPYGNAMTTAEHTIALMLALARQIPAADRSLHAGRWERSHFVGVELGGKTLGLIGCGNVGSVVASRAQGLRMRVIAYDPFLSPERAAELSVEKVDLDVLFARADFVSLHAPLTEATRDMIDARALASMKRGVRVINCARGGLIAEDDLRAALASGHVAGAALDVFAEEPPGKSPLLAMENVVVTPHLGASTTEAQEKVARQIAEQMSDYLNYGAVANAVNMPSVSAEEVLKLRPYMQLARQLGSFAGQLTETGLKAVVLEYEGHAAGVNTRALTAIALEGLLSPLLESVNMVNAPLVAKERHIAVSEVTHERSGIYQALIRITVTTERYRRDVAGTLFADDRPRVVQVKGISIEAALAPHMLYITNEDRPGIIGGLGSTLGDAGVNIATFHLGRAERGGDAIALIEVDQPVPEPVLARIRALDGIHQAKTLRF